MATDTAPLQAASLSAASPPDTHRRHVDFIQDGHQQQQQQQREDRDQDEEQPSHESDSEHAANAVQVDQSIADLRATAVSAWLVEHYEPKDDISLPRSALYDHYLEACQRGEAGAESVNSATFGKIIRAVFPTVGTRRLGTRGHSKYHYYGIGLRDDAIALAPSVFSQYARMSPRTGNPASSSSQQQQQQQPSHQRTASSSQGRRRSADSASGKRRSSLKQSSSSSSHAAMGHSASSINGMPPNYDDFCKFLESLCTPIVAALGPDVDAEQVNAFSSSYQQHVHHLLRLLVKHDFALVERASTLFWHNMPAELAGTLACDEVLRVVVSADDHLYQTALLSLLGDVLEPIPIATNQAIRQFAKAHPGQLLSCLTAQHIPPSIRDAKMDAVSRFCHSLRRRTSLNHLSQAVSSIFRSADLMAMLQRDWAHVDLNGIREQAGWVVRMRDSLIAYVDGSFRAYLQEHAPLPVWAQWIEGMAEQCLVLEMNTPASPTASGEGMMEVTVRSLLHRWAFFGTMVIRDLTLRSASSFGSFHLIKLWMDEYLFYYLEHKMEEYRRTMGMLALYSQSFLDLNQGGGVSNAAAIGQQTGCAAEGAMDGAPAMFDWTALLAGATTTGGHQPFPATRFTTEQQQHEHHDDAFRKCALDDVGLEPDAQHHHYTADPYYHQAHLQHPHHARLPHHQSKQSAL